MITPRELKFKARKILKNGVLGQALLGLIRITRRHDGIGDAMQR